MKNILTLAVLIFTSLIAFSGCGGLESSDRQDRRVVEEQQLHYGTVLPVPYYDYSIPRDVLIQIYNVVTQEARSTYTVIESITGETKFHGPSMGYGIPADVSLTNPLKVGYTSGNGGVGIVEQPEPNGLFSSKNTDGTWVLFVDMNGDVTPIYTEHKVTTYPFMMEKLNSGEWVRADSERSSLTIDLKTN